MTIPVTTRAGKGSALSFTEGDDNFTNLARNAAQGVQGNIEIATQVQHTALTDITVACVPGFLTEPIQDLIDGGEIFSNTLSAGKVGVGTFAITDRSNFGIIFVEGISANSTHTFFSMPEDRIVNGNIYAVPDSQFSGSGGTSLYFRFNSDIEMEITAVGTFMSEIDSVSGANIRS